MSAAGTPRPGEAIAFWITNAQAITTSLTANIHSTLETKTRQLTLPMTGSFNISNALCAISCASAAGVPIDACVEALATFHGVPGRMERIDAGQNFSVFIDFTVTPQAYETTLRTLREIVPPGKRLLVLTGSCGDRMREKRPIVGKLCAALADIVVVTNEDPYTENPEKIIDEVLGGVKGLLPVYDARQSMPDPHKKHPPSAPGQAFPPDKAMSKFCVRISDRMEALQWILKIAEPGDIVLLCGKGADITMMTAKGQVEWNEREIVREALLNELRRTLSAVYLTQLQIKQS